MAMLAEPRRKQRIGPNPRGKLFTEDTDNVGRQMLLKMGWKTGDGLGSGCQGMSEPIKPKINTDARGLGFDKKEDPWVAHNEEFEQLLKSLNSAKTENNKVPAEDDSSGSANEGLENKSKSSRSRIHYHKFVKNKDLSRASTKDMSCIFGKSVDILGNDLKEDSKLSHSISVEIKIETEKMDDQSKPEQDSSEGQVGEEKIKRKKKKKRSKDYEEDPSALEQVNDTSHLANNALKTEDEPSLAEEKKKKKKKRSRNCEDNSSLTEHVENTEILDNAEKDKNAPKLEEMEEKEPPAVDKKKKKKRSKEYVDDSASVPKQELVDDNPKVANGESLNDEDNIPKVKDEEETPAEEKKMKKKKRKNNKENVTEELELAEVENHVDLERKVEQDTPLISEEETSTKRKKKKKKHNKESTLAEEYSTILNDEETKVPVEENVSIEVEGVFSDPNLLEDEPNPKKKKSKKRKRESEVTEEPSEPLTFTSPECEGTAANDLNLNPSEENADHGNDEESAPKKKKKKSKKHKSNQEDDTGSIPPTSTSTVETAPPTQEENSESKEKSEAETFGSMQFINRGSIEDYFRNKRLQMLNRKLSK